MRHKTRETNLKKTLVDENNPVFLNVVCALLLFSHELAHPYLSLQIFFKEN